MNSTNTQFEWNIYRILIMVGSVENNNSPIARTNGSTHTHSNGSSQSNGSSATSEERLDEFRHRLGKSEGNLLILSLYNYIYRDGKVELLFHWFLKTKD